MWVYFIYLKCIAEIITVTGYVNVDFEDVNNVMRNSGKAIMGSGYATGENRHMLAVEQAVHSPLLDDSDITGAKNILVYITSGTEEVKLDEVMEINEYVQDATGKVAEIIWGNGEDMTLEDGLRVTLIATGFGEEPEDSREVHRVYTFADNKIKDPSKEITRPPVRIDFDDQTQDTEPAEDEEIKVIVKEKKDEPAQVKPEEPKEVKEQPVRPVKRYELYDEEENKKNVKERHDDISFDNDSDSGIYVKRITPEPPASSEPSAPSVKKFDNPFTSDDDDVDVPGIKNMVETKTAPVKKLDQKEMLRRQRFMSFNTDFKSQSALENLENIPAYARMGLNIAKKDDEISHYSVDKESGLREENSFLHDNVD